MTSPLVECIPNFSEGRRLEVIQAIVDSIRAVPGALLLDQSSDPDHNRTVVTFAGPPQAVEQAAFAAIAKAAELIDLDKHQGEHPRIGATDVVPFVPISGVGMAECVEIARRLGKRVGEELGIPVYLYEEAAARPDRVNLADIRKGEYELLKEEIASNPDRAPDYGPVKVGPAGATVIGARQPLIAYNVYLNTPDAAVAKKVARAVRHLSGGLRFVKGLGLLVDGQAQVSMNLTNYRKTPVHRAVEMVRREAARYGASVTRSELVGLIPQQALVDSAVWYLQLDGFRAEQILESRIQSAHVEEADAISSDARFLDDLAAGTAAPGGGSAAAYSGAMAAALVAMVARLTVGKKKYKEVEEHMVALAEQADSLRARLTAAVAEDAAAYEGVMEARKLPKDTEEDQAARRAAIERATLLAAEVPLQTANKAVEVISLAAEAAAKGNENAITDAGTAAALARAALAGASLNVRVNLSSLQDKEAAAKMLAELQALETRAAHLDAEVRLHLGQRSGLAL